MTGSGLRRENPHTVSRPGENSPGETPHSEGAHTKDPSRVSPYGARWPAASRLGVIWLGASGLDASWVWGKV